jgi:hypothetical protein
VALAFGMPVIATPHIGYVSRGPYERFYLPSRTSPRGRTRMPAAAFNICSCIFPRR